MEEVRGEPMGGWREVGGTGSAEAWTLASDSDALSLIRWEDSNWAAT